MENNKQKEMMDDLSTRMQNSMQDDINMLYNEIHTTLGDNQAPVYLREDVFKYYFLDYFKDILLGRRQDRDEHLERKWLDLAGSHYTEVTIIDENNKELYNVPSLYNKNVIRHDILEDNKIDFVKIATDYETDMSVHPNVAANRLDETFYGLPQFLDNNKVQEDTNSRWLSIFRRYDDSIPMRSEVVSNMVKTNTPSTTVYEEEDDA